jgi:spore maturation protein B
MKTVQLLSQLFIPAFILGVIFYGVVKKVRVYDSFVTGAKEGVRVVVKIFPYCWRYSWP